MAALVIPGQPLSTQGTSATLAAGPGTWTRGGQVYAALVGEVNRDGGVRTFSSDVLDRLELITLGSAGPEREGEGGDAGNP